jgi:hypothetical protein
MFVNFIVILVGSIVIIVVFFAFLKKTNNFIITPSCHCCGAGMDFGGSGDSSFDPCECVASRSDAMQRLLSFV